MKVNTCRHFIVKAGIGLVLFLKDLDLLNKFLFLCQVVSCFFEKIYRVALAQKGKKCYASFDYS